MVQQISEESPGLPFGSGAAPALIYFSLCPALVLVPLTCHHLPGKELQGLGVHGLSICLGSFSGLAAPTSIRTRSQRPNMVQNPQMLWRCGCCHRADLSSSVPPSLPGNKSTPVHALWAHEQTHLGKEGLWTSQVLPPVPAGGNRRIFKIHN